MRWFAWLAVVGLLVLGCGESNDGDSDTGADSVIAAGTDSNTNVGADTGSSTDTATKTDSGTDAGADADAGASGDAGDTGDPNPGTDIDAEIDTDSGADTVDDTSADTDDDTSADTDDGTSADTVDDTSADTDNDTGADTANHSGGDTGIPSDPPEGLGICQDLGGPDGAPEPVSQCLEPTGGNWNLADWQYACESDWDHHGVWSDEAACPSELQIGQCAGIDGGFLIGASFDGMAYAGTWVYYSTEFNLVSAEAQCGWAGGVWFPG